MSGCPDGAFVAERVSGVTGFGSTVAGLQETFWAIRRFLEWTGRDRPLVVILDDLQWAEPTLLDLVEYLAGWSRDVSMLLLCLARPDLMDVRPTWGGGIANASVLSLDPLDGRESERLVSELLGGTIWTTGLSPASQSQQEATLSSSKRCCACSTTKVCSGAREIAGWRPPTSARCRVPESIQALLGARLDRLSPDERLVIRSAAVVGKVFWWGAVEELVPGGGPTPRRKRAPDAGPQGPDPAGALDLRRRGRIPLPSHPDPGGRVPGHAEGGPGGAARGIRDLAGGHCRRSHRGTRRGDRLPPGTGVPISGRARPGHGAGTALATRAGLRLSSAGIRAFERRDIPAAADLLGRATALLPRARPERRMALLALGEALEEAGDLGRAQAALEEAEALAREAADEVTAANAGILRLSLLEIHRSPAPVRRPRRGSGTADRDPQALSATTWGWSAHGV